MTRNFHLKVEWSSRPLIQGYTLPKILGQLLPRKMEGDLLDRMIAVCVDDPNWNLDRNPPRDKWHSLLVCFNADRHAVTLSSIVIMPSKLSIVQDVLKEAIVSQDGTDKRWNAMTSKGIVNLTKVIQRDLGRQLMVKMRGTHNSEIEEKVSQVIFVLTPFCIIDLKRI